MSRFSGWANRTKIGQTRNAEPQPQQMVPVRQTHQMTVQSPMVAAPPPRPIMMLSQPRQHQTVRRVGVRTAGQTCALVKPGDSDGYGQLLSQLPDLAHEAGIDLANGRDAMKVTGIPEQAAMMGGKAGWSPNARYYNGVSDATARGRLDDLVSAEYNDGVDQIRASGARIGRASQRGGQAPLDMTGVLGE